MPFEKRPRLDYDERVAPGEESRQGDHRDPERGSRPARLDLAFGEQSHLLSQEEILGNQRRAARKERPEESKQPRFYWLAS